MTSTKLTNRKALQYAIDNLDNEDVIAKLQGQDFASAGFDDAKARGVGPILRLYVQCQRLAIGNIYCFIGIANQNAAIPNALNQRILRDRY